MPVFTILVQVGGAILTRTLGWAGTLMFGRVPGAKRGVLVGIIFGALVWGLLLLGLVVPLIGARLMASVPSPWFVPPSTLRIGMLAGVVLIPILIGVATVALTRSDPRAAEDGAGGSAGLVVRILRGYPLTALMAPLLAYLAVLALSRKIRFFSRGWTEDHVPLLVKPGGYETVVRDLQGSLAGAGLELTARPAPPSMTVPARILANTAGPEADALVPDHLVQLTEPDLVVLVYPSDLMIVGRPERVRRARAALASRLTTSAARLTAAREAQELEDRIGRLGQQARAGLGLTPVARVELRAIDAELARLDLSFDDWQVVYRERLQVERDLREVSMDGRLEAADSRTAGRSDRLQADAALPGRPSMDGPRPVPSVR